MPVVKKPVRLVHSEGHLDLCYDDEGNHILTSGPDGNVRIFEGFDDDDPVSKSVGEVLSAVAYKNEHYYAANENNAILGFTFKEGEPEGLIMRFTLPVTHMCFNKDGSKLLAGAGDFTVKVIDMESSSHQVVHEHEAPVLSVALHPDETLAASSSCDGTVKISEVQSQTVVKTITGLPKSNDYSRSTTLCRLAWSLNGKHLYIPMDKEVQVYNTQTWKPDFTLTDSSIKEVVSVVSLSPCGQYLAASYRDGNILIWDMTSKKCLLRESHPRSLTITGLAWNPKGNKEIAYTDSMGNLGLLENVLDVAAPVQEQATAEQLADLFDDEDDDMLVQATNPSTLLDPLADSDDEGPRVTQSKRVTRILDDDGDTRDTDLGMKGLTNDLDDNKSDAGTDISVPVPRRPAEVIGWQPTPMQAAFQPSSCPVHWSHRYMVWNSVGIILHYNTEDENSINIEFHDTATHHAMHVANTLEHTMADLSSEAVVLATGGDDDSPSKLVCMHFSSWDNNTEWSVTMPEGEQIQAVAAGEGWLAAATSQRHIRIFSVGGMQREVISVAGPVVAMAGHTNQLLTVYHSGMALPGDQCLSVKLQYITGKKRTVLCERLPLSTKSTLAWLGFSAEGTPFTVDSMGVVRMLSRGFGQTWVQVSNMKQHCKGKSDNYFVVGIHENPQQLRAVMCKGSKYPQTLPRPTVALLPFKLPVCEDSTEKATMEEGFWRTQLFSSHLDWWTTQGYEVDDTAKSQSLLPQQEALMKMFALACKSQREFRAMEICQVMSSHHTVQLAIKYATRLRLTQLAQRLGELARQKLEEETLKAQQEQGEMEEEEEDDFRPGLEAGYSHVQTGWSSRNGHQAPPGGTRKQQAQAEEEVVEDDGDIYEQIEDNDMETEDTTPAAPRLKMKSREEPEEQEALPESFSQAFAQGQQKKNPFKVGSQKTPTSAKGTSVFDSMEKPKSGNRGGLNKSPLDKPLKKITGKVADSKKKGGLQAKLFPKKKAAAAPKEDKDTTEQPSKTGFQLWFDSVRSELEEEHPDQSDTDLTMTAAKRFKELTDEEKKEWQAKARLEVPANLDDSKKRKREDNENEDKSQPKAAKKDMDSKPEAASQKKNVLSENTSSKLAGFSFAKS